MHCRNYCGLQTNKLNVKSFVKTPEVLIGATNRCHNELRRQLTRKFLDIPQVLETGMHTAVNQENVKPTSNDVLSGTIQHKGSSHQSGHYVTHIFSDSGSDSNLVLNNDTKIQSYKLLTLSASDSFNDLQCHSQISLY